MVTPCTARGIVCFETQTTLKLHQAQARGSHVYRYPTKAQRLPFQDIQRKHAKRALNSPLVRSTRPCAAAVGEGQMAMCTTSSFGEENKNVFTFPHVPPETSKTKNCRSYAELKRGKPRSQTKFASQGADRVRYFLILSRYTPSTTFNMRSVMREAWDQDMDPGLVTLLAAVQWTVY